MIIVEDVSKHFGKLEVLNNINLQLEKEHCVALIGPNGCGKTTLIKCILGMVMPQKGRILFQQKNIYNNVSYRTKIGYMPQIGRYPEHMTIQQIMDMLITMRGKQDIKDKELFEAFNLSSMLHKKMSTLSGGTTQKVSAMLAFLFQPDALILDEPTAGLDPIASEILKEKIIRERNKGKLILITSHLLHELDSLIDQVVYMDNGRVTLFKSVDELIAQSGTTSLSTAITFKLKQRIHE